MYRIGIDLGGTNIALGVVDRDAKIVYKTSTATNRTRSPEEITADMARLCAESIQSAGLSEANILGVGIGSPGIIDSQKGEVVFSNNIAMTNFKMADRFKEHLDMEVKMDNDANCAALGEMYAGKAKGHKTVIMITLGTGIGGGVIINGHIFGGSTNAGTELGHILLQKDGEMCTCGRNGCWEAYASVTALIRQAKRAAENVQSVLSNVPKLDGKIIFDAAKDGDVTAKRVIDEYISYVAEGIVDLVNIFQPEIILIGGGISGQGEKLLAPVREYVKHNAFISRTLPIPRIERALLGNDAGIIGAAMLV